MTENEKGLIKEAGGGLDLVLITLVVLLTPVVNESKRHDTVGNAFRKWPYETRRGKKGRIKQQEIQPDARLATNERTSGGWT